MQSSGEKITEKILKKNGVNFKKEFQILPDRKFRLDFICKIHRYFAIEIDGEQHNNFFSKIYDLKRDYKIKKFANIKIYRVSYKNLEKKIKRIIFYEKFISFIFQIIVFIILFVLFFVFLDWYF